MGETVVSGRAGETINEFGLALAQGLKIEDLANSMHVYPSYGMDVMRMTADAAVLNFVDSFAGKLLRRLGGFSTLP